MKITRGDYKIFKIQRISNGEVIKELPEKMYFTVKKDYYTDKILIQKTLENGIQKDNEDYYNVEIVSSDTDNLNYGKYVCDIEIKNGNKPKTIFKDEFIIEEEVTFAKNEV
jgi:hypothetical protein